ncbi:hypothetical protein ACQ4LE_009263 [Meloidogyne hapla]|uniref:ZP domain-containing protein n=1 Tax=Meloidogyne hapla TaxID=6305 RepID=A0A1I8BEY8_MELHA
MNGRLYANYEPCPFPKVRITNSTDPFVAPDHNIQEEKTLQVEGNFVLEVPLGTGNITVEAECPSKEPGNEGKMIKSNYLIELAKVEWDDANELLLFNDVDLLAFGYPNQTIGIA